MEDQQINKEEKTSLLTTIFLGIVVLLIIIAVGFCLW